MLGRSLLIFSSMGGSEFASASGSMDGGASNGATGFCSTELRSSGGRRAGSWSSAGGSSLFAFSVCWTESSNSFRGSTCYVGGFTSGDCSKTASFFPCDLLLNSYLSSFSYCISLFICSVMSSMGSDI